MANLNSKFNIDKMFFPCGKWHIKWLRILRFFFRVIRNIIFHISNRKLSMDYTKITIQKLFVYFTFFFFFISTYSARYSMTIKSCTYRKWLQRISCQKTSIYTPLTLSKNLVLCTYCFNMLATKANDLPRRWGLEHVTVFPAER